MEPVNTLRHKRIAKNTLLLYFRMAVLMLVGLYTSRVVLGALGEEDYGIYNVVGGFVAMFTIVSGALTSAVSRFITYEMGLSGESSQRLGSVFSASVIVQALLAVLVVIIAEILGLWFIYEKMTIPPDRIEAAVLVLHFSVISFAINIFSVPYMALITAHERMSAYAWISLFDGFCRLATALLVLKAPIDRLVFYASLMCVSAILVRIAYAVYCRCNFPECRFRPVHDRSLFREMGRFAGWNFIGVASGVLRDQGNNVIINLFTGPAVNAARGVAFQLNGAIQGFVTNFMTAVNPQLTKSYASGEKEFMFSLVRKSARFSYYLLLLMAVPVILNMDYLLAIWLRQVPEHTSLFAKLFLVFALSEAVSNPLITVMLATGNIRNYQLAVGGFQLLNVPISYLLLRAGFFPEVTVVVAIVISQCCLMLRLLMLRSMVGLPVRNFLLRVYLNVLAVTAVSLPVPLLVSRYAGEGLPAFLISLVVSVISVALSVLYVGCSRTERAAIFEGLYKKMKR